jgi:hypothetical protein
MRQLSSAQRPYEPESPRLSGCLVLRAVASFMGRSFASACFCGVLGFFQGAVGAAEIRPVDSESPALHGAVGFGLIGLALPLLDYVIKFIFEGIAFDRSMQVLLLGTVVGLMVSGAALGGFVLGAADLLQPIVSTLLGLGVGVGFALIYQFGRMLLPFVGVGPGVQRREAILPVWQNSPVSMPRTPQSLRNSPDSGTDRRSPIPLVPLSAVLGEPAGGMER